MTGSIDLMQSVALRCGQEEKIAWTLVHAMNMRPQERETLRVLSELLYEHLADTVTMVEAIPYLRLAEVEGGGESGSL
jgi:hypothetical protein